MVHVSQKRSGPTKRRAAREGRRKEMALRSRIVVLVVATLMSVAGASATVAVLADDAHAAAGSAGMIIRDY